jgi:iron-sulfur cluster repair protein YtfE (RIC family)
MPLSDLGIYVMDVQQPYISKALLTFTLCSETIHAAHSEEPGARILADSLSKLSMAIKQHLLWEEQVFFPYLRLKIENRNYDTAGGLSAHVMKMKSGHKLITRLFNKTRVMSNHYKPAQEAPAVLKLCYAQLFDFEQDMLKHIFIIEDILVPKLLNRTQ